jgi:putative transcriptional regulator
MMDEFPSLAGQALIAMPSIGDPRFERTVIYLCVHDKHGAMGVVVNRPEPAQTVGDVLGELGLIETNGSPSDDAAPQDEKLQSRLDARVLLGGPVEKTRGFVLHSPDVLERDGTVAVTDDIHLSTKIDVLRDISLGKGPDRFLLALGFANWGEGQLDQEILQNAWLHAPMGAKALFETPPELHYAASLSNLGVDVTKLSPVAGRG